MNSKSIYKIPNGKLIKIFLEYNKQKNTIKKIRITGDFFAYPEEAIEVIENNLKNIKLEEKKLFETINSIIKNNNFEFIGLNAKGLSDGIMMCLK
jgi:hypothetical protein